MHTRRPRTQGPGGFSKATGRWEAESPWAEPTAHPREALQGVCPERLPPCHGTRRAPIRLGSPQGPPPVQQEVLIRGTGTTRGRKADLWVGRGAPSRRRESGSALAGRSGPPKRPDEALTPRTSECGLIWNRVKADVTSCEVTLPWGDPNPT